MALIHYNFSDNENFRPKGHGHYLVYHLERYECVVYHTVLVDLVDSSNWLKKSTTT